MFVINLFAPESVGLVYSLEWMYGNVILWPNVVLCWQLFYSFILFVCCGTNFCIQIFRYFIHDEIFVKTNIFKVVLCLEVEK